MQAPHEFRDSVAKILEKDITAKTEHLINHCYSSMQPRAALAGEIRGLRAAIDAMNEHIRKIYGEH